MPLLLRLKADTAKDFLDGVFIKNPALRKRWQGSFQVLCSNTKPEDGKPAVWVGTMATQEIVERIARPVPRRSVDSVSLGRPLDTQALGRPSKRVVRRKASIALATPHYPRPVVMGVIDDGIGFANERFRKIVGGVIESRVENWWLQDGPNPPPAVPPPAVPPPAAAAPTATRRGPAAITGSA